VFNFHCNNKDHPHHDGRLTVTTAAASLPWSFSHAVSVWSRNSKTHFNCSRSTVDGVQRVKLDRTVANLCVC